MHRNHSKLAPYRFLVTKLPSVESLFIYHMGKLAHSKSINIRNLILAHKGIERLFNIASFYLVSAQRIRTVENHHLDSLCCAGLHDQTKSADERI